MGAKIIAVSADDITYYTLPGNQGELTREGAVLDDTIFGQTFKSGFPGIIGWGVNANALYKGYAGYQATIKKAGTPTTMTDEATTLVSGKTYQITASTKRIIDHTQTVTVKDNAVDHTADVDNIDYLYGKVTFKAAYTVTGPVTITGKYLSTTNIGKARSYTLTQTADALDTTDFGTASSNGGFKTAIAGLRTVTLELPSVYDAVSDFEALLIARNEVIIELNPDGAAKSMARGFFRLLSTRQQGNVGALEEETLNFSLSVPIETTNPGIGYPFKWNHDVTSLIPAGVKVALDSFENQTLIYARYLPDGAAGFKGQGVVTNFTLTGAMEAMNSFQFTLAGSGAPVAYP